METKKCARCEKNKPFCEYRKCKNNSDGYKSVCKECVKIDDFNYRKKNNEIIKIKAKTYRDNNKESLNKIKKDWRKDNPEKAKQWFKNNPERVKELARQSAKNFRKNNRITVNIRNLIRLNLTKKGFHKKSKTNEILGCSFEYFNKYLESKFETWMSWDNYGNPKDGIYELNKTWDIDHIIPLSTASTEEDIIKLNHYSNLQPLCSYFNRFIKSNKLLVI